MLKIKSTNSVLPGGFRFLFEQTGFTVTAADKHSLIAAVEQHLRINNLSMKLPEEMTLWDVIEDQMCRNVSPSLCYDPDQKRYTSVTVKEQAPRIQIASFLGTDHLSRTLALISRAKDTSNPFVSQEQAELRALRAQSCPYVRAARVCYSCHHAGPVRQCMGDKRRTSLDSKLYVCGKLGVYMQAAVWLNPRAIGKLFTPSDIEQLNPDFWFYPELFEKESL